MLVSYVRGRGQLMYAPLERVDKNTYICSLKVSAGKPFACIVALDRDTIGWSMCREGDTFSKKEGVLLASREAIVRDSEMGRPIPESIRNEFDKMVLRAQRYFKEEAIGTD